MSLEQQQICQMMFFWEENYFEDGLLCCLREVDNTTIFMYFSDILCLILELIDEN